MLQPRPVALAGSDAAGAAEAVERIVGEQLGAERLVPHRIGDHDVMSGDTPGGGLELRVDHRVAARDLHLHVVDDRVHLRHRVAFGLQLLAAQAERHTAGRVALARHELQLDQQPGRTAGVVMARLARSGAHQVRHQEADLGGGEELAGALPGAFRKLAQQVLVGAAQEVGLHVGQAEPVARVGEGLHDRGQPGRVEVALAVAFGGEVDQVDDAGQRRVVPHHRPHRAGQMLADVARARAPPLIVARPLVVRPPGDHVPARFRRQVEAQQLVIGLGDLLRDPAVAVLLGQPFDLVVEHVRQALEKQQRQQVILELGGVLLAPD